MQTIQAKKQMGGLFSVAREVPWDDPDIDWAPNGGWALRSACPAGGVWCCDELPTELKCPPNDVSSGRWHPFIVYNTQGCTEGTSRTPKSIADAADAVTMWQDVNMEGWVSLAIEEGVCDRRGFTQFEDVTPTSGPISLNAGLSLLMRNRAAQGIFDRPTIHIPLWFAPFLDDNSWLSQVADIAFGPGYGTGPSAPAVNAANIYITGPVEYSIMPVKFMPADSLKEWRQNLDVQIHENVCNVRYDMCGTFRVTVQG
jgi:hypothetical protein